VPQLGPPTGEFGRPVLREEQRAGIEPENDQSFLRPNAEVDADRVARLRQQDEAEAAAKAQVFFQTGKQRSEARETTGVSPPEGDRQNTIGVGVGPSGSPMLPAGSSDPNLQGRKQDFLSGGTDARIYSTATLQVPKSPYHIVIGDGASVSLAERGQV